MSALDFLRDVGKHFRVNQMVKKEAIAARLNSDEGISYTEFSYQLLQGLDYLQLYRDFGCTLQTGGNDQWGNLTAGSDLIHRVEGASVHLLTTPLLTDSSGEKFGKSAGNAIWLSRRDDEPVRLLPVLAQRRGRLGGDPAQGLHRPHPRGGGRARAPGGAGAVPAGGAADPGRRRDDAGPRRRRDGRRAGGQRGAVRQGRPARRSTPGTLADATAELPGGEVHVGMSVVDALVAVGLVESRNAARRAIGEGGASVNGEKVDRRRAGARRRRRAARRVVVLRRGRKALAAGRLPDAG